MEDILYDARWVQGENPQQAFTHLLSGVFDVGEEVWEEEKHQDFVDFLLKGQYTPEGLWYMLEELGVEIATQVVAHLMQEAEAMSPESEPAYAFRLNLEGVFTIQEIRDLKDMLAAQIESLGREGQIKIKTRDRLPQDVGVGSEIEYPQLGRDHYFEGRDLAAEGALDAQQVINYAFQAAAASYREETNSLVKQRFIEKLKEALQSWSYEGYMIPEVIALFNQHASDFNGFLASYNRLRREKSNLVAEKSLDLYDLTDMGVKPHLAHDYALHIWRIVTQIVKNSHND